MSLSSGSLDLLATIIFFYDLFLAENSPFSCLVYDWMWSRFMCLPELFAHRQIIFWHKNTCLPPGAGSDLQVALTDVNQIPFRENEGIDPCSNVPWRLWGYKKCYGAGLPGCPPVGIRLRWHLLSLKYRRQEEAQHFQDVHWLLYGQGPHWLWQMLDIMSHPDCLWIYSSFLWTG